MDLNLSELCRISKQLFLLPFISIFVPTPRVNSRKNHCLQVCAVCKKYVDFVRDKVQSSFTGWEKVYFVIASDLVLINSQHKFKPLLVQHYQKPYQKNVVLLYSIILNIYTKRLSLSKQ